LGKGGNPVFVPKEVEDFRVERGFKVGDFEGVVLVCVDAKVFYFVEWDGLVFAWFRIGRDVVFWIGPECANVDFS